MIYFVKRSFKHNKLNGKKFRSPDDSSGFRMTGHRVHLRLQLGCRFILSALSTPFIYKSYSRLEDIHNRGVNPYEPIAVIVADRLSARRDRCNWKLTQLLHVSPCESC